MKIYHPTIEAIHQATLQLESEPCPNCGKINQLVSHGFVYKKRCHGQALAVGKRVHCSPRRGHTGCGRTTQLYLDSVVPHMHYVGQCVITFVALLLAGVSVEAAYPHSTGTHEPRHAYRWLARLTGQFPAYRSLTHQPPLHETDGPPLDPRRGLLDATFRHLRAHFGEPMCACYQQQFQRAFL